MRKIFIDFDGTIIDVSDKYYLLYKDVMLKFGYSILTKNEYLKLKKDKIPERQILLKTARNSSFIDDILSERLLRIESESLTNDKIIPNIKRTLARLSKNFSLILLSFRKDKKIFFKELNKFNLGGFFNQVIVCGLGKYESGYQFKLKKISVYSNSKEDIVIGDSEDDINAGNDLSLTTVAVLSGLRSKNFLKKIKPHYIINSINDIFRLNLDSSV